MSQETNTVDETEVPLTPCRSAEELQQRYDSNKTISSFGWGEHPDFSLWDWCQAVAQRSTRLGYWDWAFHKIEGEYCGD